MNTNLKDFLSGLRAGLRSPPWAHATVKTAFRVWAWILFVLLILTLVLWAFMTFPNGIDLWGAGYLVFKLYMVLFFGRIALTGYPPSSWLPWR